MAAGVEAVGSRRSAPAPPGLLTLTGRPATAALSSTVLRGFSTEPLPVVLSQGVGDRVRNVIDPRASKGEPVDVVLGYRRDAAFRHPRFEEVPTLQLVERVCNQLAVPRPQPRARARARDPEAFVGFRLEVDGPLWGCAYFVVLDFAPPPSRGAARSVPKPYGRRFPR